MIGSPTAGRAFALIVAIPYLISGILYGIQSLLGEISEGRAKINF